MNLLRHYQAAALPGISPRLEGHRTRNYWDGQTQIPAASSRKMNHVMIYRQLHNVPDITVPSHWDTAMSVPASSNTTRQDSRDVATGNSSAAPKGIPHAPAALEKEIKNAVIAKTPEQVKCFAVRSRVGKAPGKHHKVNQDSFIAIREFLGIKASHFFGILDGHGTCGQEASDLAKKRIPGTLAHFAYRVANISLMESVAAKRTKGTRSDSLHNVGMHLPPSYLSRKATDQAETAAEEPRNPREALCRRVQENPPRYFEQQLRCDVLGNDREHCVRPRLAARLRKCGRLAHHRRLPRPAGDRI